MPPISSGITSVQTTSLRTSKTDVACVAMLQIIIKGIACIGGRK
jgi:hypothetical protein